MELKTILEEIEKIGELEDIDLLAIKKIEEGSQDGVLIGTQKSLDLFALNVLQYNRQGWFDDESFFFAESSEFRIKDIRALDLEKAEDVKLTSYSSSMFKTVVFVLFFLIVGFFTFYGINSFLHEVVKLFPVKEKTIHLSEDQVSQIAERRAQDIGFDIQGSKVSVFFNKETRVRHFDSQFCSKASEKNSHKLEGRKYFYVHYNKAPKDSLPENLCVFIDTTTGEILFESVGVK